jgi:hypothetical protein
MCQLDKKEDCKQKKVIWEVLKIAILTHFFSFFQRQHSLKKKNIDF